MNKRESIYFPAGNEPWVIRKNDSVEYVVGERIGQGGLATVSLILDQEGEIAALKYARSEKNNHFIEPEARTYQSISHPNIPKYLSFMKNIETPNGTSDGLIIEHAAGYKTLYKQIKDAVINKEFTFGKLVGVSTTIANILVDLEKQNNYIYLDLKPENILMDKSLINIFLIDHLEIARLPPQYADQIITSPYSAPEIRNGQHSQKSNAFSLSMMLYELLSNKKPFDTEAQAKPNKLVIYNPKQEVLSAIENILQKGLDKKANSRITITELSTRFAQTIESLGLNNIPLSYQDLNS